MAKMDSFIGMDDIISMIESASVTSHKNIRELVKSIPKSLHGDDYIFAQNELGHYCIPKSSSHRPASQTTINGLVHEKETINYIVANYKGGDIIHAGTYFGDFLPALSGIIDDDAYVWAYEPNIENYTCALITMLMNSLYNVKIMNIALCNNDFGCIVFTSDKEGRALGGGSWCTVTSDSERAGNKKLREMIITNVSYHEVQTRSIDFVVPKDRDVNIIHLDIEGSEKEAIKGAVNTIKKNLPLLILESKIGETGYETEQWLADLLYPLVYKHIGDICGNGIFVMNDIKTSNN